MKRPSTKYAKATFRLAGIVLLCAMAGLTVGVGTAAKVVERRLDRYARSLLSYTDAYAREIDSTLDQVNASPYPFCSDEDIALLRSLVFEGHLVKAIGRMRGETLYCTSVTGRLAEPVSARPADITTPSGRSMWLNSPLVAVPGMYVDVIRSGEATFIAKPDALSGLGQPPMTYTTAIANRSTRQVVRAAGAPLAITAEEVLDEKESLRGGVFYVSRCSAKYASCAVTGISVRDAWASSQPMLAGFFLLGCLAGVTLGVAMLLEPRKRSMPTQLRRALRRNLITVMYQPIVDVKTGKILGAEALARWTNEDGQYIRPDVFVAAAEELGFVGKLTRVVLRQVVGELGEFLRANPEFHINVNIAAADLADTQFLPMLEKLLMRNGVHPSSINLELTERSTADHLLAISAIGKLRERGHEFYIDDFGTGYSSLSYLNELAVDAIKIDRAFTDAIGTGSLTAVIVPEILAMAQALKVKVVVEGVETAEQSNYFANLDQEILAQGWHFGEAIPAPALLQLIASKATVKDPGWVVT